MALQIFDRIKERVQVGAGTGNLTLLGAPTGFKTFSSRLSVNDTTYYCVEGPNGAFEIGIGTLSGVTTLVRTTVLRSSNSDGAISIGASGQYFVFISYIADKAVYRNIANEVVVPTEGFRFSDNTTQTTSPTAAIALKADIASPTFTGVPAAPTASGGTNTTQIATTAFVSSAITAVDLSVYALLPDILPVAGTLLSYGGSRQLAAGGTVTHNGALSLGSNSLTCGGVITSGDVINSTTTLKLKGGGGSAGIRIKTEDVGSVGTAIASETSLLHVGENCNSVRLGSISGVTVSGQIDIRVGSTNYIGWASGTGYGTGVVTQLLSDAAGILAQRNGTNAQTFRVYNTYTSTTSYGGLSLRANPAQTAYEIASILGSTGGSNLPINIGHQNSAGTFTSALSVATNGRIDIGVASGLGGDRLNILGAGAAATPLVRFQSSDTTAVTIINVLGAAVTGNFIPLDATVSSGSAMVIRQTQNGAGDCVFAAGTTGAGDCYSRWEISSGQGWTAGLDNSDSDAFVLSANRLLGTSSALRIDASTREVSLSGPLKITPAASVTLATNGQFGIEMTSNTAGNLVYRGSDGTTRRSAIVFV